MKALFPREVLLWYDILPPKFLEFVNFSSRRVQLKSAGELGATDNPKIVFISNITFIKVQHSLSE